MPRSAPTPHRPSAACIRTWSSAVVHDLSVLRVIATDPVAIDHVDTWPDDTWPPSVSIQGRLADGARLSIRWHYLEERPELSRGGPRPHDARTCELVFPAPYLLNRPAVLTVIENDPAATHIPPRDARGTGDPPCLERGGVREPVARVPRVRRRRHAAAVW